MPLPSIARLHGIGLIRADVPRRALMCLASDNPPRPLDHVCEVIWIRHYSIRTEQAYGHLHGTTWLMTILG